MQTVVALLIIIVVLLVSLCAIILPLRETEKRFFRQPGEELPVALREWSKALSFVVALVAAMFAYWQFDVSKERAESDRRPWISLVSVSAGRYSGFTDGRLVVDLQVVAKNSGATPALKVSSHVIAYSLKGLSLLSIVEFANGSRRRAHDAVHNTCGRADIQRSTSAVFPNDIATISGVGVVEAELIEEYQKEATTKVIEIPAVLCLSYRSSLGMRLHHTSYGLTLRLREIPEDKAGREEIDVPVEILLNEVGDIVD